MARKSFVSVSRIIPLTILLCILLVGCECKHEWTEATCEAPKTCALCQLTEGEALGHTYADATCEAPKTCSICQATTGKALGHTWVKATCETKKTCSVCNATEGTLASHTWMPATCQTLSTCSVCNATTGTLASHSWMPATCQTPSTCSVCKETTGSPASHEWIEATTESPKTCSVCAKTEGTRIVTDSRFKTKNCQELFGAWTGIIDSPTTSEGFTGMLKINCTIVFNRDGTFSESVELLNEAQFIEELSNYYAEELYKEFTGQGYTRAQADEAMTAIYGMSVSAYAKKLASAFDWKSLVSSSRNGVYYVADGKLYSGSGWSATLEEDTYTISNNTLTIDSLVKQYPGAILTKK